MTKPKIKIDIVSDVVCPWCYIGKRRLEKAVNELKGSFEFDIQYLPFQLNPNIPNEGFTQKDYLTKKFGSTERYEEVTQYVTQIASEEGLRFNFAIQEKSPNTFDCHRIIWWSSKHQKQGEAVEAFFTAYFERGIDLTKRENLISIAVQSGLDKVEVTKFILGDEGSSEVASKEAFTRKIGVSGVPFYIINDKYTISGAQPSEVFRKALPDISAKTLFAGENCDIEGNC